MSATSSCDDRPDNGRVAPKTRQLRTGLDDGDGAERLGLGPGLGDIFTTDFRWRCGSVEARMQRDPTCPPTAPISTAEGLRPTLSTSDISPIVIHHLLTAHLPGERAPRQSQACGPAIANLFLHWSRLYGLSRPRKGPWDAELLEATEKNPSLGDFEPPPSYDDSARDIPPPYALHHIPVQLPPPPEPRLGGIDPSKRTAVALNHPMTTSKPDFGDTSNFRQVAGKGKKKNQKKAGDQENWGGSGDEGKKDGGVEEKNNGGDAGDGAVGGAGAGGGGGDDGDGGAGDGGGDDEWNSGKKKKKGKRGKAAIDEEEEKKIEEERKIKEQEEEDERKRKEEEEATAAGGLSSWPDGGDVDPGAEWGGFTKAEKKGKRGKKGKAEEEERKKKEEEERKKKEEEEEEEKKRKEEEVAEAALAVDPPSGPDVDHADISTGWGGFTTTTGKKGRKGKRGKEEVDEKKETEEEAATTTNPLSWADDAHADTDPAWATITTNDKKGKKGRKAKVRERSPGSEKLPFDSNDFLQFEPPSDPAPDSNAAGSAPFDNVDLGGTPQIDMNFGGGGALNKIEPKMDFLNFGTSWNTPNILDTYGANAPTADITDTLNSTAMDEGGTWGLPGSKKKKKQTPISSFGLGNFDTHETPEQHPRLDDTKEEGNGVWGEAATAAGMKDKKGKKKGGTDDTSKEPAATVTDSAVTNPSNNAEDTFTPLTTASSKKDRKKGKKASLDASISELPPVPQPPPPTEPPVEEEWGSFTTMKDKKKGKKGAMPESEKHEEPAIYLGGEPDADLGSAWGFAKKDKQKGKKIVEEESIFPETPAAIVVPQPEPENEREKESSWSLGGKKPKKPKKGIDEEPISFEEQPPPIISEPAFEEVGGWDVGSKKDKKKGKKAVAEESEQKEQKESPIAEFHEAEPSVDATWNSFGTKKDKKKGRKDFGEEVIPAEDLNIIDAQEAPPIVEETFSSFGRKKDKKSKRGLSEVKEDPITVVDSTAAVAATHIVADTDWMDWGNTDKKKDKKGNKGIERNKAEEASAPPPPPPAVPEVPEPYAFGSWASSKKDKKGKNTKIAGAEPPLIPVSDPMTNFLADDNEGDWGDSWGYSGRDKKKKEEEEQEQRERDAREEEERVEAEKEKEIQMAEKEKEKEKDKDKLRPGKKGRVNTTAGASKAKDVAVESNFDAVPSKEGDLWGTFGTPKAKDKKKAGRKDAVLDPPPPAPTPPAQGLTPEPTPESFAETVPDFDDYNNNSWGSVAPPKAKGKKDAKKVAKAGEFKADSKAPKDETGDVAFDFLQDNDQDEWSNNLLEEETPAKAAKSFWSLGAGSTAKSKLSKEKEKDKTAAAAEAEKAEEAAQDLIDLDLKPDDDPLMDLMDEPTSKSFKSKVGSKLNNMATKESEKSSRLGDNKKKKGGWSAGGDSWGATAAVTTATAEVAADTKAIDDDNINADSTNTNGKADGWGFWGAKKAPGNSGQSGLSGKLVDEPKKEITKHGLTNQNDSLDAHPFSFSKEPEPSWLDDQAEPPKSSKPAKPSMSSTKPVTKLSSVAARVKALEKEKDKGKTPEPAPSPPIKDFETLTNAQPSTKKSGAAAKLKATSASKNASWEKQDWLSAEESKETADFVPGSFPAEGADDDIVDVITVPVVKKSSRKNAKPKKAPAMDPIDLMDLEVVPEFENSSRPGVSENSRPPTPPPAPEAPPTPPPEPVASKPAKKERARVVRDEGASSWGFWGAGPKKGVKKEVKAKDDADLPSPFSREKPGLTRSKTTKVGKEKETEKSSGKSSGSDKEKKPESRPSKSRGSSFGGLFGGPPPARPRPIRRPSVANPKNASRRQSMDIDALGLPSPPMDDTPEMSSKAATLMGTNSGKLGRKESVRGKPKASGKHDLHACTQRTSNANHGNAAVPDPYPIDDDDMVMVNDLEDPVINAPIPKLRGRKDRSSKARAEKEVKLTLLVNNAHMIPRRPRPMPQIKHLPDNANGGFNLTQTKQASDAVDDVVMVEGGPSNDGTGSPVAQDGLAFTVERPKPLQRSSTSAKKPGNSKLMGFFGGFQKSRRMSETYERTRSKNMGDDDEGYPARKRTATGEDDGAKRIRRDDRRIRRSERPDVTINGLVIDPPRYDEGIRLESRNSESKREERRATRPSRGVSSNEIKDSDALEGQDRRARRRESERPRDDGPEKARDSRDKKVRKEEDQDALRHEEKRAKRATKEDYAPQDLGFDIPEKRSKHRERDPPEASTRNAESSSRPHRSDRRRSRTGHPLSPSGEPERRPHRSRRATGERSSHRKSTALVEDYFDPRNGGPSPEALQPDLPPLTQENHEPYMHGANDHTSSWVKSQISEPAPPPPLEPSVLDPTPVLAPVDDEAEQEARRAARRRERRRSKYGEEDDADRRRRRRSGREGVRSSEGSGDGGRGFGGAGTGMGYGGIGGGGVGKRGSWFKKIGLQI